MIKDSMNAYCNRVAVVTEYVMPTKRNVNFPWHHTTSVKITIQPEETWQADVLKSIDGACIKMKNIDSVK